MVGRGVLCARAGPVASAKKPKGAPASRVPQRRRSSSSMRWITIALLSTLAVAPVAVAQTTTTVPNRPVGPAVTVPNPPTPNAGIGTAPGTGVINRNTGPAAASGDRNQPVATTDANAPQPAHGRNSFTAGEAQRRIERNGYTEVTGLRKDGDGVWRGTATKGGNQVKVWLDYKGNVGAS